jgi:hypothetical protein
MDHTPERVCSPRHGLLLAIAPAPYTPILFLSEQVGNGPSPCTQGPQEELASYPQGFREDFTARFDDAPDDVAPVAAGRDSQLLP